MDKKSYHIVDMSTEMYLYLTDNNYEFIAQYPYSREPNTGSDTGNDIATNYVFTDIQLDSESLLCLKLRFPDIGIVPRFFPNE